MEEFPTVMARDLDLGSGHTAYRHASLILYIHAKFHGNRRNFLCTWQTHVRSYEQTDGRTYVRLYARTNGQTFETGFIRSTVSKSRPNNSLVGGRARAESNPGHWARHALLHMVAECVNHSATRAGGPVGGDPVGISPRRLASENQNPWAMAMALFVWS